MIGIAAHENHPAVVECLLDAGAEWRDDAVAIVRNAMRNNHREVVELFLARGMRVARTSLLMNALATHRGEFVDLMLENGADIPRTSEYGFTPLLKAAELGHEALFERCAMSKSTRCTSATASLR